MQTDAGADGRKRKEATPQRARVRAPGSQSPRNRTDTTPDWTVGIPDKSERGAAKLKQMRRRCPSAYEGQASIGVAGSWDKKQDKQDSARITRASTLPATKFRSQHDPR